MNFMKGFKCIECGLETNAASDSCRNCGSVLLDIIYDYNSIREVLSREDLDTRKPLILKKWKELLPINTDSEPVSLGERETFLIKAERLGKIVGIEKLYLKDETAHTTASFKDRSMPVAVTKAKEEGAKVITIASTGNAASAAAAYAAAAGMTCVVFIPDSTQRSKIAQAMAYGAKVVAVKGFFDDAVSLYKKSYQTLGWHPVGIGNQFRWEGDKTPAFEIAHQLDWKVPNWVVIPSGSGEVMSRIWKGFEELHTLGWIDSLPKIASIQSAKANALERAFKAGEEHVKPVKVESTLASGIAVGDPLDFGTAALRALRKSGGTVISLTEEEILESWRLLGKYSGIYAEPAGAITIGGVKKLVENNIIHHDEMVVCFITGHGLKNTPFCEGGDDEILTVEPDFDVFRRKAAKFI